MVHHQLEFVQLYLRENSSHICYTCYFYCTVQYCIWKPQRGACRMKSVSMSFHLRFILFKQPPVLSSPSLWWILSRRLWFMFSRQMGRYGRFSEHMRGPLLLAWFVFWCLLFLPVWCPLFSSFLPLELFSTKMMLKCSCMQNVHVQCVGAYQILCLVYVLNVIMWNVWRSWIPGEKWIRTWDWSDMCLRGNEPKPLILNILIWW